MQVFVYGSLVGLPGRPARLVGFRRTWGVAMDNRMEIPGYKVYEDPVTGERPAVFVAFLDLARDGDAAVDGVLLDVDDAALAALDVRERNYERSAVEVDGRPAWLYTGSDAGRGRFAEGRASEALVATREYLALVGELPGDPPPCPVRDLRRVDL